MVFLRWFFQCTGLVYGRNSLEYYHHRASGRKAVLQICGPGGMALRQGDSLRRRRRLADSEYHLDDYYLSLIHIYYYSSKKWGRADSYDFCLNSSVLGVEGTVKLIIQIIEDFENQNNPGGKA